MQDLESYIENKLSNSVILYKNHYDGFYIIYDKIYDRNCKINTILNETDFEFTCDENSEIILFLSINDSKLYFTLDDFLTNYSESQIANTYYNYLKKNIKKFKVFKKCDFHYEESKFKFNMINIDTFRSIKQDTIGYVFKSSLD